MAEYDQMKDGQGGVCDICRKPEIMIRRGGSLSPLSVDHNHATGKVRALLCSRCNHMIGMAKEQPSVLRAAADYLEKHERPQEEAT